MHLRHAFALAALASVLSACGGNDSSSPSTPAAVTPTAPVTPSGGSSSIAVPSAVTAAQAGYAISVFAQAPGALLPDDLVLHGGHLFAVAQDNNANPDGTPVAGTTPQSELVEYDMSGNAVRTYAIPGHPDGLMEYDANTLWVSTNEDANGAIVVIDTANHTQRTLTPDATPAHGGGFDDMKLLGGTVYVAASHPTLGAATTAFPNGVSSVPALYAVTLNGDGKTFHLSPSLMGNASATQITTNTLVTLSLTDPDSMAVDPAGDLVVDSQADAELAFVANPGASQSVRVLPLTAAGTAAQIDDYRWAPTAGSTMYLADNKTRLIYRITANAGFTPGTLYASGKGTLWQIDTATGAATAVYTGMGAPKGLIFVAN